MASGHVSDPGFGRARLTRRSTGDAVKFSGYTPVQWRALLILR